MNIVENDKSLLPDFIRLNEVWISTYFELEDIDHALANNPARIIDDGGFIFSLLSDHQVLGVCALVNEGDGLFELSRMTLTAAVRGKGYSHALIMACLEKLEAIGARKVYLLSNTKLEAAIALYRKHGFITTQQGPHPVYSRANITMERDI